MKFPFIFKPKGYSPWTTWPTCTNNLKTLSFRARNNELNPTHLLEQGTDTIESDNNYRKEILSNGGYAAADDDDDDDIGESAVTKGLRSSDRLFFEPGNTSSILEEPAKSSTQDSRQSSTDDVYLLEMDSINPIIDFRVSMEEMVEARGLKNWVSIEKLLARYLRVNQKRNHGYVIAAFVELMLDLGLDLVSCDDGDDDCCTSNCAEVDVNEVSCSSLSLSGNTTFPMSFCSSSSCSSTSPCPGLSLLGSIVDDVKSCSSSR